MGSVSRYERSHGGKVNAKTVPPLSADDRPTVLIPKSCLVRDLRWT